MEAAIVLIFLIYGILFGCLSSYIASTKNRDVALYFAIGFFLGIIGLIVAVAVPKLEGGEGYIKCPHCAEMVRKEAGTCRFCGKEIRNTDEAPYPADETALSTTKPEASFLDARTVIDCKYIELTDSEPRIIEGRLFLRPTALEYALSSDERSFSIPYTSIEDLVIIKELEETPQELLDATLKKDEPFSWYLRHQLPSYFLKVDEEKQGEIERHYFSGNPSEMEEFHQAYSEGNYYGYKACTSCGAKVEADAEFCCNCADSSDEIEIDETEHEEKAVSAPEDTKECPFCCEIIKARAIKCRYCGSMLDGNE